MNVTESSKNKNVLPLFGAIELGSLEQPSDSLQDLLLEAEAEAWTEAPVKRVATGLVTANQFPDQSLIILEKQLVDLKVTMARLKFYLSDLDDLLPR